MQATRLLKISICTMALCALSKTDEPTRSRQLTTTLLVHWGDQRSITGDHGFRGKHVIRPYAAYRRYITIPLSTQQPVHWQPD
ncbi:hypothetical protein PM082_004519 [Marasmius tenuissimus]|nr:hypothetical protein PM082_004519 [Marasmius tenuissimus]